MTQTEMSELSKERIRISQGLSEDTPIHYALKQMRFQIYGCFLMGLAQFLLILVYMAFHRTQ